MFTTAVVLLACAQPASAEGQGRAGAVLEILTDGFGLKRDLRGHVVQHREATLVLRADDARVHTVNTAALDTAALRRLAEGRPVVVSLKGAAPDATTMPIATAIELVESRPAKVFRRVEGIVKSVTDDRVVFETRDGMTVTLERARIVGETPHVVARETATLVYEQEPQLAGVWIEARDTVQPSASVGTEGPPVTVPPPAR